MVVCSRTICPPQPPCTAVQIARSAQNAYHMPLMLIICICLSYAYAYHMHMLIICAWCVSYICICLSYAYHMLIMCLSYTSEFRPIGTQVQSYWHLQVPICLSIILAPAGTNLSVACSAIRGQARSEESATGPGRHGRSQICLEADTSEDSKPQFHALDTCTYAHPCIGLHPPIPCPAHMHICKPMQPHRS